MPQNLRNASPLALQQEMKHKQLLQLLFCGKHDYI
jgi:hypothetical protein